MRKRPGERQEPWLLIKSEDKFARKKSDPDILEQKNRSAATGRTMSQIAADKKKVWHSKPAKGRAPRTVTPSPKSTLKSSSKSAREKKSSRKKKTEVPDFIEPTLATLGDKVPTSRNWLHEIKFDGYRMQARIAGGEVTLKTRTGLDWTKRFPTIAAASQRLAAHDVILDGEIVSGNEQGVSDFSALQDDLKSGRHDRMVYYVFDLLHFDGADLTGEPLTARRKALEKLVGKLPRNGVIRFSEAFDDGPALLGSADKIGLEGVLSKQRDAAYHSGRSGDWVKTKCTNNQEFIVAGYEPSDKKRRAIRSLLLAYYDKRKLRYAGRVGTGWNESKERDLMRRLEPLVRNKPPFDTVPEGERRRNVRWVEPRVVAEIDFRGWTGDSLLRQASFQGVREDKPANQVVRETGKVARG
jgi:bifunctional non-homologous end joining protein LigD